MQSVGAPPEIPAADVVLPKPGTKLDLLIRALATPNGATIEQLTTATGWQAHSVRGAISGALKKARHLAVTSEKIEGRGRIYRIVTASNADAPDRALETAAPSNDRATDISENSSDGATT